MAKRVKRQVEKWGGRKLQATVNGKEVSVKKDPHNLTYFMNPPKADGRGRGRKWLTRDLGRAANDFWAYVEQSYQKQNVELPKGAVQTKKLLPIIHRLGDDIECEEEYEARRDYLLNEYLDGGLLQKDGEM